MTIDQYGIEVPALPRFTRRLEVNCIARGGGGRRRTTGSPGADRALQAGQQAAAQRQAEQRAAQQKAQQQAAAAAAAQKSAQDQAAKQAAEQERLRQQMAAESAAAEAERQRVAAENQRMPVSNQRWRPPARWQGAPRQKRSGRWPGNVAVASAPQFWPANPAWQEAQPSADL
jgi:hypothetical protein